MMISRVVTILLLVSSLVLCTLYGWTQNTPIVQGRGVGNAQQKVRLEGIDCPEKEQPFGQTAKKFTSGLVENKDVWVVVNEQDRYGRLMGGVFLLDIMNLNHLLVINGGAWWCETYSKLELKGRSS